MITWKFHFYFAKDVLRIKKKMYLCTLLLTPKDMKRILTPFFAVLLLIATYTSVYGQKNIDNSTLTSREIARQTHNEAITRNTMQLDSLTGVMVSVQKKLNGAVDNIEKITERIEDNTFFDWRAWVAWGVAIIALFISWITYRAQTKTENNTKKLTQDAQRDLLIELVRHLYRNFVITYTMRTKMDEISYNGYPSEEHFQKLKIPLENLHLDSFYGEDDKYKKMHNLYLNFRNYNEEIDVAMKHLTDKNISKETKMEDFDTLEFKASFLTGRIMDVVAEIWKKGTDAEDARNSIKEENNSNAKNNQPVEGCENFSHKTIEDIKKTRYSIIYTNDHQLKDFVDGFNEDVKNDRMKNERGAWKVRMIKF